jgi:UDP-4-amino-4,6-dideoxy-N-acetyl-beta-L-altrosamine transaminase
MNKIIPYGKQNITDADILEVVNTLKSDYLTQGPKIKEFEKAFSKYVDVDFAIAVSNGTAALHLSILALDLKKGDKVITTPITFSASANCIEYCGGEVVFADIDPETYLIDYESVKSILDQDNKKEIKGLVLVDFAGKCVDLEKFKQLAIQYNLFIISDACHSPGGYFLDSNQQIQKAGNGVYADLTVFSFHPVKHIACGEGGMITTKNKILADKIEKLRSHGITRDSKEYKNTIEESEGIKEYPGWYMEMQELGYNYRLTDIQAALGVSQLKRAPMGLSRRREIASLYYNHFKSKNYILHQPINFETHAYHLYVIQVKNRLELYNYLKSKNIFCQIHYIPVHLMPYYKSKGWKKGDLPEAENYYKYCISLPMYPELTNSDLNYIIKEIDTFYNE